MKQIGITEDEHSPVWRGSKGEKPISEMSKKHLQLAKLYAQRRELYFFNKMNIFSQKIEELEAEAEKRGFSLKDLETDFHTNRRKSKKIINNLTPIEK